MAGGTAGSSQTFEELPNSRVEQLGSEHGSNRGEGAVGSPSPYGRTNVANATVGQ